MPVEIPVTAAGERTVSVNVGPEVLIFRTYYAKGADRHWLLDIRDGQSRPLISGINLVPGVNNLLKGQGDVLDGYQLRLEVKRGTEKDLDAPGNTMSLYWYNPGEVHSDHPLDPMDTIGTDLW